MCAKSIVVGQVGENQDRETSLRADYHQTLWMMMIK